MTQVVVRFGVLALSNLKSYKKPYSMMAFNRPSRASE